MRFALAASNVICFIRFNSISIKQNTKHEEAWVGVRVLELEVVTL